MSSLAKKSLISVFLLAFGYLFLLTLSKHIDSQRLCTGFAPCLLFHNNNRFPIAVAAGNETGLNATQLEALWTSGHDDPTLWPDDELAQRQIPDYVFEHAPFVHLSSSERFWPSDLGQHLAHVEPHVKRQALPKLDQMINLDSLDHLNDLRNSSQGQLVFLHSDCDAEQPPAWLTATENIPRSSEEQEQSEDVPATALRSDRLDQSASQSILEGIATELDVSSSSDILDVADGGQRGSSPVNHKQCRSVFGWKGSDHIHCTNFCDATAGPCHEVNRFANDPHMDLRKRDIDRQRYDRPDGAIQPGKSQAPAVLIVVPKDDGIVDAFWFFFYSYNYGPSVLDKHFGNHLGDWEHTAIRFKHGQPHSAFLSAHSRGNGFSWDALEKYSWNSSQLISSWANHTSAHDAKRPVTYSAVGSHAMYATPGVQPYGLPWGLLHDVTDRGPLWDPVLNTKSYVYDPKADILRSSTLNPKAPTGWFHYAGRWGTMPFPYSDPRQYSLVGEYHYKIGPTGPKSKYLDREAICPNARKCRIRRSVKLSQSPRLTARNLAQDSR